MKLLRLKVDEAFRSLQAGFEVEFLQEWDRDQVIQSPSLEFAPYILAGPNGSGKSNVLEVLAAIFYHMECMYLENLPDSFEYEEDKNPSGYQSSKGIPDAFEIEYLIRAGSQYKVKGLNGNAHVKITKCKGESPQWFILNLEDKEGEADLNIGRTVARDFLPSYILGYSSGENEVLSLPFFKMRFINYDEYYSRLFNQFDYDGKPEGRMVYLDSSFSQAIVICNLLLQEQSILKPFAEEVGVEDIESFRIIIRQTTGVDFNGEFFEDYSNSDIQETGTKIHELTEYLHNNIEALKRCATTSYQSEEGEYYFDYYVNEETRKAFRLHFGSALELFQVFQIMLTLNLYTVSSQLKKELYTSDSLYVSETVPVLASDKRIMRFKHVDLKKSGVSEQVTLKSLSDGEHQFLHALGLCLLYQDDNALFLLDEPETHFNPSWRAQFISRLRECFEEESVENILPEMLITTHTPFLISDCKPEQVLVFEKKQNTVTVSRPDYNTLGASINKITLNTFNKRETIGGYAWQELEAFRERFEISKDVASNEEKQSTINMINHHLGDSVEKVLLIKTILDSMKPEEDPRKSSGSGPDPSPTPDINPKGNLFRVSVEIEDAKKDVEQAIEKVSEFTLKES